LIDDSEVADVEKLTEKEKQNGISGTKKYYVPYDKGDKDGNRWYLETPFAIAWSQKNVEQIDSLEHPVNEIYDTVLTNYPFSQNTDYGSFYGFETTDANPIFLKHIFNSLKKRWQVCSCCARGGSI
jgi:hypothetical protein